MSVRRPARWKRPQEPRCHGREEAPLPSAPDRHLGDGIGRQPRTQSAAPARHGSPVTHLGDGWNTELCRLCISISELVSSGSGTMWHLRDDP